MPEESKIYELLIEEYLSGQMNDIELDRFKKKLSSDESFAKEFEVQMAMMKAIEIAGENDLRKKMKSFEAEIKAGDKKSRPQYKWFLAIAASFAIAASVWVLQQDSNMSGSDLFQANFEIYDSPTLVRGSEDLSEWEKGIEAYNNKQFQEAYDQFEKSTDQATYLRNFYQAQCLASMDPSKLQDALLKCEAVLSSDNDYMQQSKWYKALFLLKLDRTEDAKKIFQEIIDEVEYNSKRAQNIMNSLE